MTLGLDLLERFRQDLYRCSDCNYCVDSVWTERGISHVCATIEHHSPAVSYSGRGFLLAARALLEGQDLNPVALAERVFSCTACGNCESVCPLGLRPAQVGQALRETLAADDVLPPAVQGLRQRMRGQGNAYGAPGDTRAGWADGLHFATSAHATVHYSPGCATAYGRPVEARAAMALLKAAGELVYFSGAQDSCCGAPLREAGLAADADHAEARLVQGGQVARLVASGLECLPAWGRVAGSVLSFPAWLLEVLGSGRLTLTRNGGRPLEVQVFDSCAMRRVDAVSAPVRAVLQALGVVVMNPVEARHAVCCGAGGSLPTLHPTSAARMAASRCGGQDTELPVVGVDVRCMSHLATGGDAERYFTLAEFLVAHFTPGARA